ncbi:MULTISPECIES: YafY family protein [unclassified Amycolatopsis]|uniref:helix-turn-helix transcriptional regulator n=1 Tax=unclassified Amycolatopsis TaxID=2618356 RepID=UPI001FF66B54|nr:MULTISPECIES: WYL domain-containing protein [unclassified Amycolatopsis]UOZ04461.1 WYL domain-containing protein [Amycolatopsis sp. WQ 127309]WSJ79943.1 WYL domain-containing protein [Amycolatopsis sp. NBC_01307]WSK76565.1 WYL domain-containing protein [Amycolatopsis sp. NBC_01286]
MSTARAERLVNLVLALLSTRQFLTAERIRGIVPGYGDAASDDAYFRMFERDKTELRELGIPLETGRNSAFDAIEGYRIARRDYELGEIDLAPDEAAAVALASRLWDSPELTGQAQGALVKLRAAGLEVDDQAPTVVEPRVRAEPAFGPLLAAVQNGQAVRFEYRRSGSPERIMRTLEPWGVVSWKARWYVVGHDRDRGATRCFRLSRVTGQVRPVGKPGAVQRPEGVNLLQLVSATSGASEPAPVTTARLWVADGRAAGVRRRGTVIGRSSVDGQEGDLVEIGLYFPESAADWITAQGPDVVVLEPDVLAKTVQDRLEAVVARQQQGSVR